jgi:hypothetical protein
MPQWQMPKQIYAVELTIAEVFAGAQKKIRRLKNNNVEEVEFFLPPGHWLGTIEIAVNGGNESILISPRLILPPNMKIAPPNLFVDLPLTYMQITLGASVQVKTLEGEVKTLKIPEGTNFGQFIVANGMGLPLNPADLTRRGPLIFQISHRKIENMDEETKEMLRKIQEKFEQQIQEEAK